MGATSVNDETDEVITGKASGLLTDSNGEPIKSFEPGMILYAAARGRWT